MKVTTEYNCEDIIKLMDSIVLAQKAAEDVESYHILLPSCVGYDIFSVLQYLSDNWDKLGLGNEDEKANLLDDSDFKNSTQNHENNMSEESEESLICFGEDKEQCEKCAHFFKNISHNENVPGRMSASYYSEKARDILNALHCLKLISNIEEDTQ